MYKENEILKGVYLNKNSRGAYNSNYKELQKDFNAYLFHIRHGALHNAANMEEFALEYFGEVDLIKQNTTLVEFQISAYMQGLRCNIEILVAYLEYVRASLERMNVRWYPERGKLIVVEGCDCIGKDHLLDNIPIQISNKFYVTREPGGTELGTNIRKLLLDSNEMCMTSEIMLFAASRAQYIKEVIEPTLDAGVNIISNRFYHSSIIYQSLRSGIDNCGLSMDEILEINKLTLGNIKPDLVISLYTNNKHLIRSRMDSRGKDRIESGPDIFESVNKSYKNLKSLLKDLDIDETVVSVCVDEDGYDNLVHGLLVKEICNCIL